MSAILRFLSLKLSVPQGRFAPPLVLLRSLAWLLAALTVGWVTSGWFWQIAAPDAAPAAAMPSVPDPQSAARVVASRHLFGRTSLPGDQSGDGSGRVRLNLLGAMTSTPDSVGFAILAEEGKPSMAVVEGETFMPGTTLVQILPGKVRVKIGEREELIEMTKQPSMEQAISGADSVSGQRPANDAGLPGRQNGASRAERPRP